MEIFLYAGVVISTVLSMEFVAWFAHKCIMHGLLWDWHEDHHKPELSEHSFYVKNDRFFLVFAIPSALAYILGTLTGPVWLLFIGIGISIYGLIYFLIHDVYIHRRFEWFEKLDNPYSKAIQRAHGAHHSRQNRKNCESFGLLVVHPIFFRKKKHR